MNSETFEVLSEQEYESLCRDAEVIRSGKVLALSNGDILKLYRVKRVISSALFYPYSKRFYRNALQLQGLGIATVEAKRLFRIPSIRRSAVLYAPLPGITLRDFAQANGLPRRIAAQLGVFVATLHDKGIYFRSLSLNNIIYTESGEFGLIDFADMKIHEGALSPRKRLRNFRHVFGNIKDFSYLDVANKTCLLEHYLNALGVANESSWVSKLRRMAAKRPEGVTELFSF